MDILPDFTMMRKLFSVRLSVNTHTGNQNSGQALMGGQLRVRKMFTFSPRGESCFIELEGSS